MKVLRTKEVMEKLNISKKTLENYQKRGWLHPIYVGKLKYFYEDEINNLLNIKTKNPEKRKIIAYYRVSTNGQKKELENQRNYIENYIINNGKIVNEYMFDIGSGINFERKNFLKLINMIENGEVEEIIITHKDRLTRFAFELIEERCKIKNTKITIINLESTSPEKELVEDLMTIIHVFSSRLYGLRKYKNLIKKEVDKNDINT